MQNPAIHFFCYQTLKFQLDLLYPVIIHYYHIQKRLHIHYFITMCISDFVLCTKTIEIFGLIVKLSQ